MRSNIFVTGPDRGGLPAWLFTAAAIWRAGGRPVRVRPTRAPPPVPMHGLVLGGGVDISPELYGGLLETSMTERPEAPLDRLVGWTVAGLRMLAGLERSGIDERRDAVEAALADVALREDVPVLAICRGMQLLNVVRGGDLEQSVRSFYGEDDHIRSVFPRREVVIDPESRLASALGTVRCRVNALHEQAVRRLGRGLAVAARDDRGLVQAIEARDAEFAVGVQWHPEFLPQLSTQTRLFTNLVGACRRTKAFDEAHEVLRALPASTDGAS